MKSAKVKKTAPSVDWDVLNLPLPEIRQILENIKEVADQLEIKENIVCTKNKVARLLQVLTDLLQLYKDKKVTLQYLQEILAKLFPRGSDTNIKRVIVLLLGDLGIIPDVITAGDCEEFKALLAIGDRIAFQTVFFEYSNANYTGLCSIFSYYLLSFTVCYGTSSMLAILDGKGYQPLLSELPPRVPFADPIAIMLSRNEKPDEIMKRCCLLVQGMNASKKKQFFKTMAVGATDVCLVSPLTSILYKGKEYDDVAKFLLRVGVDAGQAWCNPYSGQKYCPIELILSDDRVELLQCIPDRELQVLMKKDLLGSTIFQWAIDYSSKACINHFLKKGMITDVNIKAGNLQRTALMMAAWYGDNNLVCVLLKKGARLDAIDSNGYTALTFAICTESSQSLSIVKLLLSRGDKPDQECMKDSGLTPLHLAVIKRNYVVMELLLKWGASSDKCALDGNTPVDLAMQYRDYKAIDRFVDAGVDLYECRRAGLSLALYLFYYYRELFERLCAVNKMDLNQRNKERRCFWDYLKRYDNTQIGYLCGEVQELMDDPIQEAADGDSVMHSDPIGSAFQLVRQEALQKEVLSERLATGQRCVTEKAVFTEAETVHQSEKEIEARICAQNAELTRERKQRRRQQRALPLLKQEAEEGRESSHFLSSVSLLARSSNVSPPPTLDRGLEDSTVVNTPLSLVFAAHLLDKKDQKVYEAEASKPAKARRSKGGKPLQVKSDTSHLTNFHVKLPLRMEQPASVLVHSYSEVVDVIARLRALVTLEDRCTKLSARLASLAVLGDILTLTKFCCSTRERDPLCQSVKLTKVASLRDAITQSYQLPSEKDILNATQAFVTELPSGDSSLNILTLIILFQKNVCYPLFPFYSRKQGSMNGEQGFLTCYQAIYHAFRMLQVNYSFEVASHSCQLNPAAGILFIAAHALRKALNLTSEKDNSFQTQWDSLVKEECLDWGGKTFSSVMYRGKWLMRELHHRLVGPYQFVVEGSQADQSFYKRLPQPLRPEDLNTPCAAREKAMPLYKLWEGPLFPLLSRSENREELRTGCDQIERQPTSLGIK